MRDELIKILQEPIMINEGDTAVGCRRLSEQDASTIADRIISSGIVVPTNRYRKAVNVLQAIAQHEGTSGGYFDEWTEAYAFKCCQAAAIRCLKALGENLFMSNKRIKK